MKKRAISLFLVVSMSFTFFYPSLSLNDNVLEMVKNERIDEKELTKFLQASYGEKEFRLRIVEWLKEICQ